MFKRRRDVTDWPVGQIAKQTLVCFTSDPDQYEVRAAAVLHLDPSLLPKDIKSVAFNVFGFAFHHDDRIGLYMDVDPTVLVKMQEGTETLDEAEELALGWCGDGASKRSLHNIPGVYQVAYMQRITGNRELGGSGEFGWAIERGPNGCDVVREFPPKVNDEGDDSPDKPEFVLLSSKIVDGFQREFGW
jgi:hypothetical protein